ncbi:MAG: 50S ribosomal protein L4 [Lentisphaerae bacterium]|jgi:large subunit ribosomal protein L4|nr:50S ribosomal protein L4 [Lentisphaerota bacterium]
MSKINLFNSKGEAAGTVDFADDLLVLDRGEQAVKDVVVATLNARRAGTASTLSKGEVAGSNKKLWRQKGTGRARTGVRQSPIWRGGGVAMGPKPRSFATKINRKAARLAFRRALSGHISKDKVIVIESFDVPDGKTRQMAALLQKLGAGNGRVLLVTERQIPEVERSARNLPKVEVATADNVDVYSLLASRLVVATREALDVLAARMQKPEVEA